MVQKVRPYWPAGLPDKINYLHGEMPLYQYLEYYATNKSNEIAYYFYGTEITWKTLLDHVNRFACYLQGKGFTKGSYAALYLQNCPQYIIAHYAIQQLGGIVVPLNPMFKESELAYCLQEASISVMVTSEEAYETTCKASEKSGSSPLIVTANYCDYLPETPEFPLTEEFRQPKRTIQTAEDMYRIIHSSPLLTQHAEIDLWNDVGLMVFTSGTTGRPKGAMLTYGNALFKTAASVQANGLTGEERFMAHAPLCHIAGMLMGLNTPIYTGNPCVLFTRFDPVSTMDTIEKYKITSWYSVAPMNGAVLQIPGVENRDFSSLKVNLATSFGLQVTQKFAEKWRAVTKGCLMYEAAYGLSETHTCDTFMPRERIKYGSCGIPIIGTEMKILSLENGEEVPAGESGEIVVRNPGVYKGYLNRPEATVETLKDGWLYTGDIGYLDQDGYLFFQGRLKEMIKSSGYSIFPEDVEALLNEHPAIRQSAVIGVPDPMRGETIKAFVVLHESDKDSITPGDIISWAKGHMAAYKYPRYVEIIEQLPATPSGKVLRKLLKDE
ncbi:class I adenylate-forming enzyme family protein [Peribacillus glennii]|uniref:AMP-dependent synthetase n=1 Tax=Peribacillus glennii TaxID=2303991 RepID=A0A372LH35_9BACI|nr:AMP-binding protein [Peribacillus glennii]RFU65304.1 AMP-dependent synthetase [Peribacillus glennii]